MVIVTMKNHDGSSDDNDADSDGGRDDQGNDGTYHKVNVRIV